MALIKEYGEMLARNPENIKLIPRSHQGGQGVYVLYSGWMPVYIGKGNIRSRINDARRSKPRGKMWDHFSWYVPRNSGLTRDIEALLLRMLPIYLRILTHQVGKFTRAREVPQPKENQVPELICQTNRLSR